MKIHDDGLMENNEIINWNEEKIGQPVVVFVVILYRECVSESWDDISYVYFANAFSKKIWTEY